jgi:hypothetical protein
MYCVARRARFDTRAADAADAFAARTQSPSPELGYFPGAKQGSTPERTAIVLCAGVAGVAAILEDAAIL